MLADRGLVRGAPILRGLADQIHSAIATLARRYLLPHPAAARSLCPDQGGSAVVFVTLDQAPEVVVLNCGEATFNGLGPIIMGAEEVVRVCRAAPDAQVVAVHLEALNHCVLSRAELAAQLAAQGLTDRVKIPADGEGYRFSRASLGLGVAPLV